MLLTHGARSVLRAAKVAEGGGGSLMLTAKDVSTTMIYTHVLKVAADGTASPLDAFAVA